MSESEVKLELGSSSPFENVHQWRNHGFKVGGDHHGERGSANLYGVWGGTPVESRGKAPGQGVRGAKPP